MENKATFKRYGFRSPPLVVIGLILAGPLSPALLVYWMFIMEPSSPFDVRFAVWALIVPASLGVAIAFALFVRSHERTGKALFFAIARSVLYTTALYFVAMMIFVAWSLASAGLPDAAGLASLMSVILYFIMIALIWGPLVAALSYIPARLFALKRVRGQSPSPQTASAGPPM